MKRSIKQVKYENKNNQGRVSIDRKSIIPD